jgi:hypothetical protein
MTAIFDCAIYTDSFTQYQLELCLAARQSIHRWVIEIIKVSFDSLDHERHVQQLVAY